MATAAPGSGKRTYAECDTGDGIDDVLKSINNAELLLNGSKRRRVSAAFRPDGGNDTHMLRRVLRRQLSSAGAAHFTRSAAQHRMQNMRLQSEMDTFEPDRVKLAAPFLQRRSKVVEIVSSGGLVFALTLTGICAAYDTNTSQRLCYMNTSDGEIIRSLFLNKANNSLITVSVFAEDNYSSLKCKSTPLEYVRRKQPEEGFELFTSELLKWPGFVEFDDTNERVLTYSASDRTYKIWDLANYTFLYSLNDPKLQEIKISMGIMLLIFARTPGYVPLRIVDIETGEPLKDIKHLLHRSRKVDFIEQFNEKLLVKQENENLQIVDVRDMKMVEVSKLKFTTPSAFIFLYQSRLFLTFKNGQVSVWNFKGELVTQFADHRLWYQDTNTNNVYITSNQETIISYCRQDDCTHGSINVSSIADGSCFAKITCSDQDIHQRIALEDITALFYNEDQNKLYTGNKSGIVHMW
eukprot:CAMPEP_0182447596 /NCGR_PEP_ID=MMETSP1172-20130603/17821_1 /TAXON_ID=708627 /ORGANISM="Timspurckia oligopyrenoides, Strain CCMP3278" /LENGTH=464 /DNA_ID=CAMNT_0024644095 /DNA_START=84 /DNA_END=1475 /DNA_ORIENTATION=-